MQSGGIDSSSADKDDVNDIEDLIEDDDDNEEHEIEIAHTEDDSEEEDSFAPINLPLKAAEALNSMNISVGTADVINMNLEVTFLKETTDIYDF